MSNSSNYGLIGISSNVRYGRGNGYVKYTAGSGFSVLASDSSTLTNLSVADATAGTHAVALEQLYALVGSNTLTAGSGISFTAGTIATVVDGTTILNSGGTLRVQLATNGGLSSAAGGVKLNYTNLATAGTVHGTDLVAISQSGVVVSTTVTDLVNAATSIPPSASVGTIVADSVNSTFNVGFPLPDFSGLDTYVTKVKMTVETPFAGGSVANAEVSDGTNTLMTIGEDNIGVANTYWIELPLNFISSGDQCVVNFTQSDGVTPAIPTSGTAVVSIEYVLVGPAGSGGGGGGGIGTIVAGTGLTGGTITTNGTIAIATTGVTAGTYGNGSNVPKIVINALGQITSATNIPVLTGNVTGPLVATDSAVALYDGSTGQLIKNSSVTIDGTGNISANSLIIGTSGKQISEEFMMYNTTTNATATELFLDGSTQRLVLPDNATWFVEVKTAARRTDAASESDIFWFEGGIDRQSGAATTAMVGTRDAGDIEQSTNWTLVVDNDTSHGSLRITATGEAGKTVRWAAFVRIVETLD